MSCVLKFVLTWTIWETHVNNFDWVSQIVDLILFSPFQYFPEVACPALSKVPHVLVIHGESDGRVDCIKVCLGSIYLVSCLQDWLRKAGWKILTCYTTSLIVREANLQSGFCTNHHCQFHLGHTIQRPCCLYILKEWELLCIQRT